jgi:very-short-patch-repair endonuclease
MLGSVMKRVRSTNQIDHRRSRLAAEPTAAVETAIATLSHRQHGFVTRKQLLELGLTPAAIKYRTSARRLIPVYAGVYAVGHIPLLAIDRAAAAVLACGPDALLSHSSAMCLWGFWEHWKGGFEVTTPTVHVRRGITVHRSRCLTRHDITHHYGIRVTSPARTILDTAQRLNDRRLTRVVNDARRSGFLRLGDLWELLQRHPRSAATARMMPFVVDPAQPTRSDFEDLWSAFSERYDLPENRVNVMIGGREVDVLFEKEGVIVELDGYRDHSNRTTFESDRERDVSHLELDLITVRLTWRRFTGDPDREAARLHRILAMRRRARGLE